MGKGSNHFLVPFALFLFGSLTKEPIPWNNAFWPGLTPFWPTAVVGEADSVISVSAKSTRTIHFFHDILIFADIGCSQPFKKSHHTFGVRGFSLLIPQSVVLVPNASK